MNASTNALLEGIVETLEERELDALLQQAEALLDECGLEVEADSYEEYADVLASLTVSDFDAALTESDKQELVEVLGFIADKIKKAAQWVGSKLGAAQAKRDFKAKKKAAKSRARRMAWTGFKKDVKDAFQFGKEAGKTDYDDAQKAKKLDAISQRKAANKGKRVAKPNVVIPPKKDGGGKSASKGAGKGKPGQKMVFGKWQDVKPNMAGASA